MDLNGRTSWLLLRPVALVIAAASATAWRDDGLSRGARNTANSLEWHGFRRGVASNLYKRGANDKWSTHPTTRELHVTKERYIKAFDPAVLAARKNMEASLEMLNDCSASVQQVNEAAVESC